MLLTSRFAYYHFPKTGGTFLSRILREHFEILAEQEPHTTYADAPHNPGLVFVRNPWDWYVSWFFECQRHPEVWLYEFFEMDKRDFRASLEKFCLSTDAPYKLGHTMEGQDVDFLTANFVLGYGDGVESGDVSVGRYEAMQDDFLAFLERNGAEPTRELVTALKGPPVHVSDREPYQEYYDDELRELVAYKARLVIDRFGYEF